MHKSINQHKAFIEERLSHTLTASERTALQQYHQERVRDFQHERLIHLLVTFFFALLLIASAIGAITAPFGLMQTLFCALTLVLLLLELAYIRHYYYLENGTQSLYDLTERLFKEESR